METILDKLDTRFMRKLLIPLEPIKINLPTIQNINLINLYKVHCKNENEKNTNNVKIKILTDTIPITRNKNVMLISKILKMCPLKVYYPMDSEPYPIQRSLLYNMLVKMGIDMENNSTIENNAKKFINLLPRNIDLPLLNSVTSNITINETENEGFLWLTFVRAYTSFNSVIPSYYDEYMRNFENSIIPGITAKFDIPNDEVDLNAELDIFCDNVKYCDNKEISSNTIYTVLKNYDKFVEDKFKLENLKLCPVEVEYILNSFPFHKGKMLKIEDGFITTNTIPFEMFEDNLNKDYMKKFEKIKKLVKFDGNYENFKNIIQLFNISYDQLHPYMYVMFNNLGFKCATICAEVLSYNLQSAIDSMSMYNLISKLSDDQQNELELKNTCKVKLEKKLNLFNELYNFLDNKHLIKIKHKTIFESLEKLQTLVTAEDKIIYASRTNFNCIPLLQIYTKYNSKDVLYLLLYSSAPINLKNLIYEKLITNFDKFPINYNVHLKLDVKIVDDNYSEVINKDNSFVNCLGLLDIYKNTNDSNILDLLNTTVNNETR